MADVIAELLVSETAVEKLGARGISVDEAQQVPRNANVTSSAVAVGAACPGAEITANSAMASRAAMPICKMDAFG